MKVVKIIVATADYDPLRSKAVKVAKSVAEECGIELEVKKEDWDFLIKYGEEDELGGYAFPQFFVVYEDGSVKHVLTQLPLDEKGKVDLEAAKEVLKKAITGQ